MSFLNAPIPPLDHEPHAAGAPPGVNLDLGAYDAGWVRSRPLITPKVGVVHTNGGSGEGSYRGAIGWANSGSSNTHAHYNLNESPPSKNLATNRRAIANSTPPAKEIEYGVRDCSYWSIAIETADRGYNNGGQTDLGDFLHNHDELLARIIAYESIVWSIPISVPPRWVDAGWASHTAPWDGVYTIYKGKSCPGTTKKNRLLGADHQAVNHDGGDVLARARKIKDAWTGVDTPVEIPMLVLKTPQRIFDTRPLGKIQGDFTVDVPADLEADALMVTITAVQPDGKGYAAVAATYADGASCLNYNSDTIANTTAVRLADGKFALRLSTRTHVLVDVVGLIQ